MRQNPKSFYSSARSRQNTRSKVGPFKDPESGVIDGSPDYCCRALQKQYESVFSSPRPQWEVKNLVDHFRVNDDSDGPGVLSDIWFSQEDIKSACLQLSAESAAGPDGIPAAVLKFCRENLSLLLYHLWRGSFDCGIIPLETLLVIICPIHKGGSRSLPKQ